jgi:glucokinase
VLALGGVYVAGGIAVKIIEKIKDGTFFRAFKDKWHFENMLANIPVSVVLNESAPLMGAAYEALAVMQKLRAGGTPTLVGESVRQKS